MNFFESRKIDLAKLHEYGKRQATEFYEYLVETDGIMDGRWSEHAPYLTICDYGEVLDVCPPLLDVGSKAGQRKLFGDEWADNVLKNPHTPDTTLRKNAAFGYREAMNGKPVIEEIDTVIQTKDGLVSHSYVRVLSVVATHKGVRFFALYGTPLNRVLQ